MNSKKDKLSADDVQKIFNKLVSVLRKNSHLLLFLMTGKSLSSSYLMIKRRRNTELSLKRISEALSSIAQNPEECELVEYPNGRLYKDKNKTENYFIRITFELLESICVKGIFYEDKRFLT